MTADEFAKPIREIARKARKAILSSDTSPVAYMLHETATKNLQREYHRLCKAMERDYPAARWEAFDNKLNEVYSIAIDSLRDALMITTGG